MKQVLLVAVASLTTLIVIGSVKRKSLEKTAIAKMTAIESGNEIVSENVSEKETAIVRTARRAAAGVRERGITANVVRAHQHHPVMIGAIMEGAAKVDLEETIQNFIRLILLVNNGRIMPQKTMITAKMISLLLIVGRINQSKDLI